MLANYLNQTAKGQDPNSQWRNHPAQRGARRLPARRRRLDLRRLPARRVVAPRPAGARDAARPDVGQVNQVTEIWADLTHMKGRAATASLARAWRATTCRSAT
jgi:hypothetical protein